MKLAPQVSGKTVGARHAGGDLDLPAAPKDTPQEHNEVAWRSQIQLIRPSPRQCPIQTQPTSDPSGRWKLSRDDEVMQKLVA